MLKTKHGLAHGAAHRISLQHRQLAEPIAPSASAVVDALYTGKKAALRPLHDRLVEVIERLGKDITIVQKKGYISFRRRKQFAMIQPSGAGRLDIGLILRDVEPIERLETAERFNALFTHRVRLTTAKEIDRDFKKWLQAAYANAD